MLHTKNFRTVSLALSSLCLLALLCLKVVVPFLHAAEAHHHTEQGFNPSDENCLACDIEHAAFLYTFSATESFSTLVSYLGVLLLFTVVFSETSVRVFSLLRAPPVLA